MAVDPPLVVLGVGNALLGDDAVGVRVVERLRDEAALDPRSLPAGVRLIDGGTLGVDLVRVVGDARGLVVVDAVRLGGRVGSLVRLEGDAIVAAGGAIDGGPGSAVGELVSIARLMRWLTGPVVLVGIEVAELGLGAGLGAEVAAAVPAAMDAVRDELHRMDAPTRGAAPRLATSGATARAMA